ncbi:hypothetical protein RFI_11698 [Reticulomyxa filosa]|uniref:C2 NT-type domain-containing protein n=1 Tax=Reticulomyxa filosa TaxID=46433 RepID=X6NIA9_RETFI|nr:hypothetical protein RFI_11698 [Reticulomyxa filosa]|eukprot:ETO25439.1 hypothetical protein RFI_11698 [Reticulomyxa filosa]
MGAMANIWKRGQDKPIESKRSAVLSKRETKDKEEGREEQVKLVWDGEPEVLQMQCVLIKQKQSEEYMSKQSRLLLKQVCNDKPTQPTVGMAKLDLRDYVSSQQVSQTIDIHFAKWIFFFFF